MFLPIRNTPSVKPQDLAIFAQSSAVPLLREGVPIGVLILHRAAVRPFTDKQIKLVETFADQAVIAIENARLFDEVQARTREPRNARVSDSGQDVLKVITRSTFKFRPVLSTLVETAHDSAGRICANLTS